MQRSRRLHWELDSDSDHAEVGSETRYGQSRWSSMAATAPDGGELGRRIAYVDGLRAVAVLMVVACHAAKWDLGLSQGPWLQAFLDGAHGVDLFFVLSGFCLSYPILNSLHTRGWATFDIAGYFARRVVRIVPPYYLAMVFLYFLLLGLPHVGWHVPPTFSLARLGWLDVGRQALFADRRVEFLNPSFWTLAIEWRWYFLFPLLLVLWTRSMRAFVFALLACIVIAASTNAGSDFSVLPAFMLGIVAAQLELDRAAFGRLALLLCALSLSVTVLLEPNAMLGYFMQIPTGWQVAAFFLVVAAGSLRWLRAILSVRPLVWIGVSSYSIYLIHEPLIATIEHNSRVTPFLGAILVVALGIAFWAVFERPFMTKPLKGRLVKFLQSRILSVVDVAGVPRLIDLRRASGSASPLPPVEAAAPSPGGSEDLIRVFEPGHSAR